MGHNHDHGDLMRELTAHFQPILDECPQGVYLWMDPEHGVCNEAFANMFGIRKEDFTKGHDFLGTYVDDADQATFGAHYGKNVAHLEGPIRFQFKARRKDGSTFRAETDMIPITFGGHPVAYHFVRVAK